MRGLLIPLVVGACSGAATPGPSTSVAGAPVARPPEPAPAPSAPSTVSPSTSPHDHAASATAIYDATNYVAPAELAYSRTLDAVIYPACGGGEGPGERCGLAAYDRAGKDKPIPAATQVTWARYNHAKDDKRTTTIAKLTAAFDALDTHPLERVDWRGDPLELVGFGRLSWEAESRTIVLSHDDKTTRVATKLEGGPVNAFWSADAPVAVAQLRHNPASGGREGYVVFIELLVIPRP